MSGRSNAAVDPCFSCALPDCDESSPRCALKRAHSDYQKARRKGELPRVSQTVRDGYNAWFTTWRLERDAKRSEQAPNHSHQTEVSP